MNPSDLDRAARAIREADALLVGAGAGMGVDSGLPDFRGPEGFWRAYPPYRKLGLDFVSLASPHWFQRDPLLAWGFYGHRLELYRATRPHDGFAILLAWARRLRLGAFVLTSNVDGQFQRAGFDPERVHEIHGALDFLQCVDGCGAGIFPADPFRVDVDPETLRARGPLPTCPGCGALARPNVLMFGDWEWDDTRSQAQALRFHRWMREAGPAKLVVVECGAGTAIPSVRRACESTAGTLVRLNPREADVPRGQVGLAAGALEGLRAIDARLASA